MTRTEIRFEEFELRLREVVGLPIQRTWRSIGTYFFFEIGKLHSINYTNKRTGETFTVKQGEWTLELEGRWTYFSPTGETLDAVDERISSETLEQFIEAFPAKTIHNIEIQNNQSTAKFFFDDGSKIGVEKNSIGFVNLYDHRNDECMGFDEERGIYFTE